MQVPSSKRAVAMLAFLIPCSVAAQTARYAPGSYRYEMTIQMTQKQELMGTVNEGTLRLGQQVTVTITSQHRDTLAISIVIDSLRFDMGQPVPDSAVPSFRGVTVTGRMSPLGRIYSMESAVDSLAVLADDFRTLFTTIPPEFAIGRSWVDTVVTKVSPGGTPVGEVRMVVTSRVTRDTTFDGLAAWKIERTSEGAGRGNSIASGADMRFEMTARGSGTAYFGKNGVYLGGDSNSDSDATVSVPQHGMRFPVTARGTTRVRLLGTL